MESKYFVHRIQEENGSFSKGIEVHDTLNSAILSFWGRMKTGYDNPDYPNTTFVSCKIKNAEGNVVGEYDQTWQKGSSENKFFLHYVRRDGETISKNIDVLDTFDAARRSFASQMEYGYDNVNHPNVDYVSCEITDRSGVVLEPFNQTWERQQETPEA